jgi:hypothetical protein
VVNDGKFAETLDAIGEKAPELKRAILAGEVKASTAQLEAIAEEPKRTVKIVAKKVAAGDKKAVKKAVEREPGDDTQAIDAEKAKRSRNGREVVPPKARKEALALVGKLTRLTDRMGIHERCRPALATLLEQVKNA